ncbi:hypothetical protein KPL76_04360 [Subtercola sp. PAMC28395]|uniref:SRPBCC family protein n=1 Tax=Subtercola sp. PAMC28395 TaxID=2846775 RepID=UPI001C0DC32F|nr:SRPBCC family protein [Subtercola sp. PAMC28395]QWT24621.1 hypothetical protein KPL76_04360 [Subtercola sp. PAMC28395]
MTQPLVMFTVVGVSFSAPSVAFDIVVPRDDSTLFTGYAKVLPAVVGLSDFSGPYDVIGAHRTVHLSDGGSFRETIVGYERPDADHAIGHFDYNVSLFTGVLSSLVSDATARWTYAPGSAGRTHITWTYGYRPLPGRAFVVRHLIGPLWLRYMRKGMKAVLQAVITDRIDDRG